MRHDGFETAGEATDELPQPGLNPGELPLGFDEAGLGPLPATAACAWAWTCAGGRVLLERLVAMYATESVAQGSTRPRRIA